MSEPATKLHRRPRTDAEWSASTAPIAMFKAAKARRQGRKLRLFSVACCRHIQHALPDPRSLAAIDVAERFADGLATSKELDAVRRAAALAARESFDRLGKHAMSPEWAAEYVADPAPFHSAESVSWMSAVATERTGRSLVDAYTFQADIVRDLIPSPFLPMLALKEAVSPNVVALAREIYNEQAFVRLNELVVILERTHSTLLHVIKHLRQSTPHVRGCWALDLLFDN